jgi:hypothetical protein
LADQSQALIVDALTRALAAPDGLPLLGSRAGLFATTTAGKKAAQECRSRGLVRILHPDSIGKTIQEKAALSEEGLAFLLRQTNPRPVLEALLQAIESRQVQMEGLLATARATQASLAELRSHAGRLLDHFQNQGSNSLLELAPNKGQHHSQKYSAVLAHLRCWQARGALEDCPLPDIYRALRPAESALTIGQFHDSLRRLQEDQQIYLHPWTGPLYEIPEPALALLVGHEVAYYASLCA